MFTANSSLIAWPSFFFKKKFESLAMWILIHQIFFSGNIDQAQYCDKVKGIVEFLGTDLSSDELTMIWKMQVRGYFMMLENIWYDFA